MKNQERTRMIMMKIEEVNQERKRYSNVNHPSHYKKPGRKECIDEMLDKFGVFFTIDFCLGNAMKYKYRAGLKNDKLEDLQKADWYIQKAMSLSQGLHSELANIIYGRILEVMQYE